MSVQDLVSRVSYQLEVARSSVRELEHIRDKLVLLQAQEGLVAKEDHIPGIGVMRRSDAYMAALRMGCGRVSPSYIDSHGEVWTLFSGKEYISKARSMGVGLEGRGLVRLSIVEHAQVKRSIRAERRKTWPISD